MTLTDQHSPNVCVYQSQDMHFHRHILWYDFRWKVFARFVDIDYELETLVNSLSRFTFLKI